MKKLLLILLFISLGSFMASSQSILTTGQVYNFNVGDVFETESYTVPTQGPRTYSLSIILAKWYSVHSDTIFYEDSLVYYTLPSCPPPCTGTFSERADTVFYTYLNSKAVQDTEPNNCPADWDSVYIDSLQYCEKRVWEQGPYQSCWDTLNIEANPIGVIYTYSWLIEGCGGPYTNTLFTEGDYGDFNAYNTLIYYEKNDTICGTEYVITGINPINTVIPDFKISPNPNKGAFIIQPSVASHHLSVEVYNVLGEKVYSSCGGQTSRSEFGTGSKGTLNVNLGDVPSGVYFLKIFDESLSVNKKFVVEGK